jgi:hypothetical protein
MNPAPNAGDLLISPLLNQLVEELRMLPDVQAVQSECQPSGMQAGPVHYDARVDLHIAGKRVVLLIDCKRSLYPRDAREALWPLRARDRQGADTEGTERVPMLVAESISPGAKEFLQGEKVAYFDSGGSLFVPASSIYLYVEKPPPKPFTKALRTLYSGRRAQVLHALLNQHGAWLSVKTLAEQAHVSPATASQVFTELERLDWVESRGRGPAKERQLKDPAALLDAWSNQLAADRPAPLRRFYVPAVRGDALADRVAEVLGHKGVEYAITHEAAAQRYAPFLSSVSHARSRLMPGRVADEALAILGAKPVTEGANFSVIDVKSPDELLFRQKVGDVWLASPVQVYLDLLRGEGRAKEMAAHLRREKLGF